MAQTPEGAIKVAAKARGMSVDEYAFRSIAEKWCSLCQDWHPRSAFHSDRSRSDGLCPSCRTSRSEANRAKYVPTVGPRKYGPDAHPPRDDDRSQARQRVNVEVRTGKRPHPNTLPCEDCGHEWSAGQRRHEYDHFLGYAAEHHYHVQSVCTICHGIRSRTRGEIVQTRGARGRFVTAEVM